MHVWNVLHATHWKYRTQNYAKNRHLCIITQLCRAISSQLRHAPTMGKNLLTYYLFHMSLQYGELRPTNGWDRLVSLGHLNKFQRVSCLGFVTAPTSLNRDQPRCLAISWAGTLCIHFRGSYPPNGILPDAKFTLRPNLAFSHIGGVAVWHWSSGRHPNFAAFSRGRHLYSSGRPSRWASTHILVLNKMKMKTSHTFLIFVAELYAEKLELLPSVVWHCWFGHWTRKPVPDMTYSVFSGTLNPAQFRNRTTTVHHGENDQFTVSQKCTDFGVLRRRQSIYINPF